MQTAERDESGKAVLQVSTAVFSWKYFSGKAPPQNKIGPYTYDDSDEMTNCNTLQ